jgi:hypothetical protein
LAWGLASLSTALASHVALDGLGDLLGSEGGADTYSEHAHAAVAPLASVVLTLMLGLLFRLAVCALAQRERTDPVTLLARCFGRVSLRRSFAFAACGGLATLVAMEFVEQIQAFGHPEGVAAALGGNVALGFAVVSFVAAIVTFAGLRLATWLLAVVIATGSIVAAFLRAADLTLPPIRNFVRRHVRRATAPAALVRCRGLRAPPFIIEPKHSFSH